MEVVFIVNGVNVKVKVLPTGYIRTGKKKALELSGNTGRPPEEWDVHSDAGQSLDSDARWNKYGVEDGDRIFLNLKIGVGGESEGVMPSFKVIKEVRYCSVCGAPEVDGVVTHQGLCRDVSVLKQQVKQLQSIINFMSNFPPGYGHNWIDESEGVMENKRDVHTEHCCVTHGCKYSQADCPVVSGMKKQTHPCEDCVDDTPATSVGELLKKLDRTWRKRGVDTTYRVDLFDGDQVIAVGDQTGEDRTYTPIEFFKVFEPIEEEPLSSLQASKPVYSIDQIMEFACEPIKTEMGYFKSFLEEIIKELPAAMVTGDKELVLELVNRQMLTTEKIARLKLEAYKVWWDTEKS